MALALPSTTTYGLSPPVEFEDDITKNLEHSTSLFNTSVARMEQNPFTSPPMASIKPMAPTTTTQPPTPDSGKKRHADDFEDEGAVEDDGKDFTLIPSASPTPISTQKTLFPASPPRPAKRQRTTPTKSVDLKSKKILLEKERQFSLKLVDRSVNVRSVRNMNAFYLAHINAGAKAKKEGETAPASARYYESDRDYAKNPLKFPLPRHQAQFQAVDSAASSPKMSSESLSPRRADRPKRTVPKAPKAPKPPKASKKPTVKTATKKVELEDWRGIPDVCPPIETLNGKSWRDVEPDQIKGKYKTRDLSQEADVEHLHPLERELCEQLTLRPDKYLRLKRQIFQSFVKCKTENPTRQFNKTLAQRVGTLDANKLSFMHSFFDNAGWYSRACFPNLPPEATFP